MAASKPAAKPAPKKEYLHVLMCHHPLHKKPVPLQTYDTEEEAWKAAASANADPERQHLGYHVKKVAKGG